MDENCFTWLARLWSMNDECTYKNFRELALALCKNFPSDHRKCIRILSDEIRDLVEEVNPLAAEASLYSDLMSRAISEIDFDSVAECFFDE